MSVFKTRLLMKPLITLFLPWCNLPTFKVPAHRPRRNMPHFFQWLGTVMGTVSRQMTNTVAPEVKSRGHRSGANRRKLFLVVPLYFFGSKSTISRFGERFRDDQYRLVSFLFPVFLPCPTLCKSGGARAPRAPWSRHHWANMY